LKNSIIALLANVVVMRIWYALRHLNGLLGSVPVMITEFLLIGLQAWLQLAW